MINMKYVYGILVRYNDTTMSNINQCFTTLQNAQDAILAKGNLYWPTWADGWVAEDKELNIVYSIKEIEVEK